MPRNSSDTLLIESTPGGFYYSLLLLHEVDQILPRSSQVRMWLDEAARIRPWLARSKLDLLDTVPSFPRVDSRLYDQRSHGYDRG
ncbi:hypothetical protein BHE74_00026571 [Ensete ventricosum]|nr:hypothetical protein BHE74_00026571 [Ensete ventricosum]